MSRWRRQSRPALRRSRRSDPFRRSAHPIEERETPQMSKPKLFGISGSRALRAIWGIEEVGIDYEQVAVSFGADSKAPDYLAVNPNGRIPALIDGDLQL